MGEWGMGMFGGIFMIVLWILIIGGVFFFVKWLNQRSNGESGWILGNSSKGFDILRERYARGEIDKQEFEEKKKDLVS